MPGFNWYATKPKESSEIELIVEGCRISASKLVELMDNYNREKKENVRISRFFADNSTIFGRNQELPSNPTGVYFFVEIEKNKLTFIFNSKNRTGDYLKRFIQKLDSYSVN